MDRMGTVLVSREASQGGPDGDGSGVPVRILGWIQIASRLGRTEPSPPVHAHFPGRTEPSPPVHAHPPVHAKTRTAKVRV